jgi:hypothetical protein
MPKFLRHIIISIVLGCSYPGHFLP